MKRTSTQRVHLLFPLVGGMVAAFLSFLPPDAAAQPGDTLVVGQVVDLSGLGREFSRDFVAGAKTYFDHVNSTGGVGGKRIKHVVKDDTGLADLTLSQTKELLDADRADVLFGYVGDAGVNALLASDLFKKSGAAFFGAASGLNPADSSRNVYYTRASYASEAEAIVEQFRLLGVTRFSIVAARSEFSQSVINEITGVIRNKKLSLVSVNELGSGEKDIAKTASAIAAKNPPQVLIMLADSIACALFVKAYRPIDPGVSIVSLSLANHETITQLIGPQLAHGTMITQVVPNVWSRELPVAMEHSQMMKKYRDEPPSHATFEGYIAAKTLVQIMKQTQSDTTRQGIATALKRAPKVNIGGIRVEFASGKSRGSDYADIVFLRKDGRLLR
jgi:branched-chain amino acid transport system substrate-binding protein